jgi:hypothetical protein
MKSSPGEAAIGMTAHGFTNLLRRQLISVVTPPPLRYLTPCNLRNKNHTGFQASRPSKTHSSSATLRARISKLNFDHYQIFTMSESDSDWSNKSVSDTAQHPSQPACRNTQAQEPLPRHSSKHAYNKQGQNGVEEGPYNTTCHCLPATPQQAGASTPLLPSYDQSQPERSLTYGCHHFCTPCSYSAQSAHRSDIEAQPHHHICMHCSPHCCRDTATRSGSNHTSYWQHLRPGDHSQPRGGTGNQSESKHAAAFYEKCSHAASIGIFIVVSIWLVFIFAYGLSQVWGHPLLIPH